MISSTKLLRAALLGTVISSLFVVGAGAASIGVGTTTAALRVRESAGTETTTLATAPQGESVILLEDAGNGWYKVDYKSVQGYMSGEFLTIQTKADAKIGYGMIKTDGPHLNVRSGPGTDFDRVSALANETVVDIVGIDGNWYKISSGDTIGYVLSDYIITVKDSGSSRGDSTAAAVTTSLGQQIVDYAKKFMGVKYVYGANGPNSFDCSGFTRYVFANIGINLPRMADGQYAIGRPVSTERLQSGDLVFFETYEPGPSHVGIYIGNGQFISATSSRGVAVADMFGHYWGERYLGARRVL